MTGRPADAGTLRWPGPGQLAMGARLAVTGGRDSVVRTALTALGVGLGVAMLLFASAVPAMKHHRDDRIHALVDTMHGRDDMPRSAGTLLLLDAGTQYRDAVIRGRYVRPEGPEAPLPPGLDRFPEPGRMFVSPALRDLLGSPEGALLRERLPAPVTGEVGEAGLTGPRDLTFWIGSDTLTVGSAADPAGGAGAQAPWPGATRLDSFGDVYPPRELEPLLLLLSVVGIVVLLTPVALFVAAATRFGGEARDRRLAALRLAGADRSMTARIAAGESLAGAVLGLALGWLFFLLGRQLGERIAVNGVSVFARDVNPQPLLAAAVMAAVPVLAVGVTLVAMRQVAVEPMGLVRPARPVRRRMWWRLAVPAAGAALLAAVATGATRDAGGLAVEAGSLTAVVGLGAYTDPLALTALVAGLVLLLAGIAVLLPALLDLVTGRLTGGPPSWQLAVRRLQLSGGSAARGTAAVVVAVAGAIALQSLFSGVAADESARSERAAAEPGLSAPASAAARVSLLRGGGRSAEYAGRLRGAAGTTAVVGYDELFLTAGASGERARVMVGDCAALGTVAVLASCADGSVFLAGADGDRAAPRPGTTLAPVYAGPQAAGWRLPAGLPAVAARDTPFARGPGALLLATPGAVPPQLLAAADGVVELAVDPAVPDARDLVRNAVAQVLPGAGPVFGDRSADSSDRAFRSVARVLTAAVTVTLLLVAASMLVGVQEQLRERRRVLASLMAFGTRRRTLGRSVLWQSAVPLLLGLVPAAAVGAGLGGVLLRLAGLPVHIAWTGVLAMAGTAVAAVLGVTVLTLPVLFRTARPDGLRFE
ncbi:membrane protein [Kitasatospora indigofera]|uniref:Membrane protein n=1 Tax=Kitasatospora indigofera TaxID=67307 RepID=A0A919FFE4_9ACTN|nr:FtsX-like permease family protein [Kitasatospora indigofera]GHH63695.1 membrane protein [Kitasatospora indigofera]